jgi:hypothetical protein
MVVMNTQIIVNYCFIQPPNFPAGRTFRLAPTFQCLDFRTKRSLTDEESTSDQMGVNPFSVVFLKNTEKMTSNISQILLIIALLLAGGRTIAQNNLTQTIRGVVTDKISEAPIPGVKILVLNIQPVLGTTSGADGSFKIENAPVGRQDIRIWLMGYKEQVLRGVSVDAGKETVLNIQLEEEVTDLKEVKIKVRGDKPLNDMSVVSTRTFSVEETQKYAAAVNDPSRMATSFAGVVQTGSGANNSISIRGNSPNGIIWRMEGIEVPNPNHFSSAGTSGGGISIISSQLLSHADFSTGAFAAEYGNALSGVFDLKLRKGNNEKREFTLQAGVLGIDAAIEGPFKKGYGGSYLVNYRYSTLGLMSNIVPIGDAKTTFQDLSFNVSLPTRHFGQFGVFGFGGLSSEIGEAKKDSLRWKEDAFTRESYKFASNTGMVGVNHSLRVHSNGYLKTSVALSGTQNFETDDELSLAYLPVRMFENDFVRKNLTVSTVYNHKISAKDNFRTGAIYNHIQYQLVQREREAGAMQEFLNSSGATNSVAAYFQLSHKFTPKLTTNVGAHYLHLLLNNTFSVEPRLSVRYEASTKHAFTAGYGIHSQTQPIGIYFAQSVNADNQLIYPNKSTGLSKAQHFVLGYDLAIGERTHLKVETYYQYLFHIPISTDPTSTFSALNLQQGFPEEVLTSTGKGKNYGAELTLDRALYNNFYYLLSAALYESKYKAPNGNWYDTRYNTNYMTSFTAGKEWMLKKKEKTRTFGINVKSVLTGGMRFTPISLEASILAKETIYDETRSFKSQMPTYYRLDVRFSLKRDYKKATSTVSIDFQNVLNRKNVAGQYYDSKSQAVKYVYQTGILPVLSYRLTF